MTNSKAIPEQDVFVAPCVTFTGGGKHKRKGISVGDVLTLPELGKFTVVGFLTHKSKERQATDVVLVKENRGKLPEATKARWRAIYPAGQRYYRRSG